MTHLYLFVNTRFVQDLNGRFYSMGGSLNHKTLLSYLDVFDSVNICARVIKTEANTNQYITFQTDERIQVVSLPYYIGPLHYLKSYRRLYTKIKSVIEGDQVIICRAPGVIAKIVAKCSVSIGKPYGAEITGDPEELFSDRSLRLIFVRELFKRYAIRNLRYIVSFSCSALYVTKYHLQSKYPLQTHKFQTYASNVFLEESSYVEESKSWNKKHVYNIICVGSLDQMYKGPDILIKIVQLNNSQNKGFKLKLTWLGEGQYKSLMCEMAKNLGVIDCIEFPGYIDNKTKIAQYLDRADLFVLASRTEGLPRSLIEAMARGLPCVGTRVGGIPELLPNKFLVEKDNIHQFHKIICDLCSDAALYNNASKENLFRSKQYHFETLNVRRKQFYREVIKQTQLYLDNK